MFEKEAKVYADKVYGNRTEIDHYGIADAFQDGAEFGYNKANEWHFPSKGEYPKDDKQYLVLFSYTYKGKEEMSCGVRDNLRSDFELHRCYTEQIIAWKEIVLPEQKESE